MGNRTVSVFWHDTEVELEGDFFPGVPAQLWGLPENCTPEEPAYFDAEGATIGGVDVWDALCSSLEILDLKTLRVTPVIQRLEGEACEKLCNEPEDQP